MVALDVPTLCDVIPSSWVRRHLIDHPFLSLQQVALRMVPLFDVHWRTFDIFGPVVAPCPSMRVLGSGDEEKRICWSPAFKRKGCVIFSIGSNNQWTFEEDVAAKTACTVHTFDCTVRNPTPGRALKDVVTFHSLCVGRANGNCGLVSLMSLIDASGGTVPTYLKFDAEGFEFETLATFIFEAQQRQQVTGINYLPDQIALELHYSTPSFEVGEEGILAFSNLLFSVGYVVVHRRDNILGFGGSEFLLIRTAC